MPCLFCHSSNTKEASFPRKTSFNNKVFHYRECKDCELVFIDPVPDAEDYSVMYSPKYHAQFYFDKKPFEDFSWLYHLIKEKQGQVFLDYGCGDASLLKFLNQKGFKCKGVEFDKNNVERLKKENPDIEFCTINDFWSSDFLVDIIYTGDVLEHLGEPTDFLNKAKMRLNPQGVFVARGPVENNKSITLFARKFISSLVRLRKQSVASSHVPYHITFSNSKNQKQLFERCGFETGYYKIFEVSWPYPDKITMHPVRLLYYCIAKLSIAFSSIAKQWGNRFIYVGLKK